MSTHRNSNVNKRTDVTYGGNSVVQRKEREMNMKFHKEKLKKIKNGLEKTGTDMTSRAEGAQDRELTTLACTTLFDTTWDV